MSPKLLNLTPLPSDYAEKVYAGVLGKMIGVYLGRPFEQWKKDHILRELGQIYYYVHEQRGQHLVVTDDDLSGTFTFVKALRDYGNDPNITAAQIGQTWLNTIIEGRSILWWGGVGSSTEHTAFKRLKAGIPAPESGSIALNGQIVAEQIGAQIFIDGWGLICPGEPDRAADLARRAGSVSHDGVAIHGAQIVAAMIAQAFVETDLNKLFDVALAQIPADSLLCTAVDDIREWHARGEDWESGFALLDEKWGYAKYGGGCHMIPNHALIAHALLQGQGDFHESMMVVNTCGLDTDCNAANVGTILGVRNGLAGLEDGPDWRGPVADRILLPTADVGSAISDAVQETYYLVNVARDWRGLEALAPKGGARYHFSLPNSVQGFEADLAPETRGVTTVGNEDGRLKIDFRQLAKGRASRTQVQTFVTPLDRTMKSYGLVSSPILYPGQQVTAKVSAEANRPVDVALYVKHYNEKDELTTITAEPATLEPGAEATLTWTVPDTGSQPICFVGLSITSDRRADGTVYLDSLGWSGTPTVRFGAPAGGTVWRSAWIDAADDFSAWTRDLVVTHNDGIGMVLTGTREWHDYSVSADLYPSLNKAFGLAVRVQGLKRHYAFLFRDGKALWVKVMDGETILNEVEFNAPYNQTQSVTLEVRGQHLIARIGSSTVLEATDPGSGLEGGGIAILVADGKVATSEVWVRPLSS